MVLTSLSKREKTLFYLTIGLIFFSLIFVFLLKPLGEKWHQLNDQLFNQELRLKRNVRYLRQKDEIERVWQGYLPYIKKGGQEEAEITSLLNEVEKIARASSIHIANIRPKPIKDLEFYKKYILEMDCEATMENFVEFIYELQKSRQLIRVEKLKIVSQGKTNPLLKAQMLITKVLTAQ